jgi:hypothetical protein
MTAADAIAAAIEAGVTIERGADGRLEIKGGPRELRERLRHHRAAAIELVEGWRCCCCGRRLHPRQPAELLEDGRAAHYACLEANAP